MKQVIALASKDMRLLFRNRGRIFFTFIWPIIVTVLFGLAFGGSSNGEQGKVKVAIVDDDNTDGSRAFAKKLEQSFDLTPMNRADAENAVRRGDRTGYIVITPGFGAASDRMFYGESRQIELGVDPARRAEAGMIEGLLMKHASEDLQKAFNDPGTTARMVDKALGDMKDAPADQVAPVQRFLGELKNFVNAPQAQGPAGKGNDWQPLKVIPKNVARERRGPENAFEITFPQGVIWGLIGCMMSFGISLVTERTHGTLVRLRMGPLTRAQILGGKALACFLSILLVELMLFAIAWTFGGVRPTSLPLLALAGVSAAICFVGFMMLVAGMGRTEETASGAAWAVLMPLTMLGGAMVPSFVMPQWMQSIGVISPVRWAMLAIEGGVWRNFSIGEMVLPCTILITIGIVCFGLGTRALQEA
ncbi:MAG: ABC transporter permease [Acidobacteriota bacterium]